MMNGTAKGTTRGCKVNNNDINNSDILFSAYTLVACIVIAILLIVIGLLTGVCTIVHISYV